uniref:Uncharacterized protein n=1 Tax=Fagus sylvatica TaxID=28930 RepID=A0A2N9ESE4_FAGSY
MDESKVKDIIEWPTASSIQKFRSLHGILISFLVSGFSKAHISFSASSCFWELALLK